MRRTWTSWGTIVLACAGLGLGMLSGGCPTPPPGGNGNANGNTNVNDNGNANDNSNNGGAPLPLPNPDGDDDGDGVRNADDLCPDTAQGETVDAAGCSEAQRDDDGDGVPNGSDQCADTPQGETVDAGGCADSQKDSDGDGVTDDADQCADTPSTVQVDAQGCPVGDPSAPDADGDGVGDDIDQCPDTPPGAPVDANGCADSQKDADGDGVTDDADECPDTPQGETVNDKGCAPSQLDSDGDGVTDDRDQCPDTPPRAQVDADGCPVDTTPPPPPPPSASCGNGTVEAGEECDDGNTVDGDGCSANCTIEVPPLTNDGCADALTITDGTTEFDSTGATTDGPQEPGCNFPFGDIQVGADIWFRYVATCDGEAVASLCGSRYDTKIVVYDGGTCPRTGSALVCSDDDCGPNNFNARVTFQAVQGQTYLIRVGGFEEDSGAGMLTVRCGAQVCGAGNGACGEGNGSPGCDDAGCCQTTCAVDPFCCDVEWDVFCAGEAEGLCGGSFPACAPGAGTCAGAHAGGGCDDVDCCNTTCMSDPFCCVDQWDDLCAREAFDLCFLACGDATAGGCFTNTGSPGCDNASCCETVCAEDPFCCTDVWDQTCADRAAQLCR